MGLHRLYRFWVIALHWSYRLALGMGIGYRVSPSGYLASPHRPGYKGDIDPKRVGDSRTLYKYGQRYLSYYLALGNLTCQKYSNQTHVRKILMSKSMRRPSSLCAIWRLLAKLVSLWWYEEPLLSVWTRLRNKDATKQPSDVRSIRGAVPGCLGSGEEFKF